MCVSTTYHVGYELASTSWLQQVVRRGNSLDRKMQAKVTSSITYISETPMASYLCMCWAHAHGKFVKMMRGVTSSQIKIRFSSYDLCLPCYELGSMSSRKICLSRIQFHSLYPRLNSASMIGLYSLAKWWSITSVCNCKLLRDLHASSCMAWKSGDQLWLSL